MIGCFIRIHFPHSVHQPLDFKHDHVEGSVNPKEDPQSTVIFDPAVKGNPEDCDPYRIVGDGEEKKGEGEDGHFSKRASVEVQCLMGVSPLI